MLVAALFSSTMMAFRSGKARLAIMPLSVQIPILWRQWMLLTIALLLLVQRSQKMSRFTRWPSPAHDKPTKMIFETPAAGKRSRLELGYNSIHVLAFFRQSAKISVEQFFAAHKQFVEEHMSEQYGDPRLKIFALNSNKPLAEKIAAEVGVKLGKSSVKRFSDGEIQINIEESIRGDDVYLIQSTSSPVNDNLMELLIMIDALRRASAHTINVVMPYYGYARQDRKARSREPITAKLVANMLERAGATRVLALDLHAAQIQGFFDIPVDHLVGAPLLADYFLRNHYDGADTVVVSPDHGGVTRARKLAEFLKAPIAIIDKRRPRPNVAEVMNIVGNVTGKQCIIIDDMIDTAGTITLAAQALKDAGATEVLVAATHAIFSGPAVERLTHSAIEKVVVTDSINLPADKHMDKLDVVSVGPLMGRAIMRIQENRSVTPLFENRFTK